MTPHNATVAIFYHATKTHNTITLLNQTYDPTFGIRNVKEVAQLQQTNRDNF